MTAPEIGVLLPVRIETRFVPPGQPADTDDQWRLRIRVVPDAVSVTDHDPVPSALELDAVEAMWQRAGSAVLDTPTGQQGWDGLVAAVGVRTGGVAGPDLSSHVCIRRHDVDRSTQRAARGGTSIPPGRSSPFDSALARTWRCGTKTSCRADGVD